MTRDWYGLVERFLQPFRSEAAAFRLLLVVAAVGAVILALVLLGRALL